MIFRNVSIFFSLLLLLVSATTVQAVECFAPSPSVKNNIDVYEEIKTRKLTKAEYEQLSQLFTSIKGGWKGKAETVTCKGSQDAPRQDTVRYDVVSDVETGLSNSIMIKSELHSGEKKQNYQETLTYFLSPERLGVTDSSRAGDVELINVARNFLVYLRKVNKRTPAGGLVAQEFVKSIAVYDHSLMLEDLSYSNGLLESRSTWKLIRR